MVRGLVGTQIQFDLSEPFLPRPIRTAPRVWMRQVMIFAKPGEELRRIELGPGLNVVWAPDADPEERVGSRIGHGAGKTMLCRMLRHALGEADLASSEDADALRRTFPEGFVAAEVVVDDEPFAVRRPFDAKLGSTAVRGTLEDLLGEEVELLEYEDFLEAVRATMGAEIRESMASTGDAWLAALAWMSRDQERRFGGALRWRDRVAAPRSKLARVPNVERLRSIRSLLRLRAAEDLEAEGAVGRLEAKEKLTVRKLVDCERELTWLSTRLAREGHGQAAELLEQPLHLRGVVVDLEQELAYFDEASTEPSAVTEAREKLEQRVGQRAVEAARLEERRAFIEALSSEGSKRKSCGTCRKPVRAKESARDPMPAAERALGAQEKRLAKAQARVDTARARLDKKLGQLAQEDRRRREAWAKARDRLARGRELERQVALRGELENELASVQRELATARSDRERALREHARQERHVADVFDFVLRRLAGQEVSGRFHAGATSLEAGILLRDGRRGTSPALRVLETLALDLTGLILACEDRAELPGLWIHDSPREADLARSHYDALYDLASWLEGTTATPGFQYIVTTTTNPPKSVAFRAIKLGGARDDELLLRTPLRGS